MKKILLTLMAALLCLAASANEVRYFTYQQMTRTVSYLNAQQELMIWCGYADEIETYCLVNEVWAERVNPQYYEIWLYGYDAWTGEEIYMPIDLGCIWLQGAGHRFYNAATYLRFRSNRTLPTFVWCMPPYHPYQRPHHVHGYACTYHHHVHQPGWHHPHPDHNPHHCHPYYMRDPWATVYYDPTPYHPGQSRPVVSNTPTYVRPTSGGPASQQGSYNSYSRTAGPSTVRTAAPASQTQQPASGRGTSTSGTTPTRGSSASSNSSGRSSSTSGTTPSRGTSTSGTTPGRSSSTSGTTPSRGTSTSGTTSGRSSSTSGTTSGRSSSTSGTTSGRSSSTSGTTSGRSSSTSGTTSGRSSSTSGTTSGRSSSTSGTTSGRSSSTSGTTSGRSSSTSGTTSGRSSSTSGTTSDRGTTSGRSSSTSNTENSSPRSSSPATPRQ